MLITIDGPAASGKSAVAETLARRLGDAYRCLNTGAMYRGVAWLALRHELLKLTPDDARLDEAGLIGMASKLKIDFDWNSRPPRLLIDSKEITEAELADEAVSRGASRVARVQPLRDILVRQQREIGKARPTLVSEGRDQGSVVFPDAPIKFFLTARVDVRATRRFVQAWKNWEAHSSRSTRPDYMDILGELIRRDHADTTSPFGRLVIPENAIVVDSTDIEGVEKVVDVMIGHIEALQ